MTIGLRALTLAAVLAVPAAATAQGIPGNGGPTASDHVARVRAEAIESSNRMLHEWTTAWSRSDLDALLRMYSENAYFRAPNGRIAKGPAEIRAELEELVPRLGRVELLLAEFESDGQLAFVVGFLGTDRGRLVKDYSTTLLLERVRHVWRIRAQLFDTGAAGR